MSSSEPPWEPEATCEWSDTISWGGASGPALTGGLPQSFLGRSFEHYAVERFLGKGGMAWVFQARHQALERPCAIKILCPDLQQRAQNSVQMFLAEARAAASVVHPHIVTVHNIGQIDPYHFIELEYIAGRALQTILNQEGSLPPLRATDLLLQCCGALARAHHCGLIHRDFKPSNILIGDGDYAKLADFGLAKRLAPGQGAPAGTVAGTPPYMAPELFDGQPASTASDVYAVGVSYFQLLTGQLPFPAGSLTEAIHKHRRQPPPDPRSRRPELPDHVAELVKRCLAKRPADRPPDGQTLYELLHEVSLGLRDIRLLVAEAIREMNVVLETQDTRLSVDVALPKGRRQRVYIEDHTAGPWSEHLVKIYSLCCPVREDYFRRALELNANISHGSLAIEQIEGQSYFVMINRYPRSTCEAADIRHSILDISHWADEVERVLTGEDRH